MSRTSSPRLAFSNHGPVRRTGSAQMSPANAFEGRGRRPGLARARIGRLSPRTVTFASPPNKEEAAEAWSRFIRLTTKSRIDCAKTYDKTFQTACNWYDGTRVPTGDVVMHAFTLHPALAAQLLTGV